MAFDPERLAAVKRQSESTPKGQFDPKRLEQVKAGGSGSTVTDVLAKGAELAVRGSRAIATSPALRMAGGIAGGIAGGVHGGPAGAIAGAGLGGAAGESARQMTSKFLGYKPGEPSDISKAGLEQMAGEAGGRVLGVVGKSVAPLAKDIGGSAFQILTKMKPDDAATLFKNPKALLPGQWTKAQAEWRAAAKEIGIPVDEVSPEMVKILEGDAKKMVMETYGKMIAGETVSAKEAQLAKQAIDIAVMPVAKTVRKNPLVKTLSQIRESFVKRIGEESPRMAAANKEYGIAATGKRFRSVVPRNSNGEPAYFRSSVLPMLGLGSSIGSGEPEDFLKALSVQLATGPLAIGGLIAAMGASRGVGRQVGRVGLSALAETIGNRLERD